jgi:hypothetical protein
MRVGKCEVKGTFVERKLTCEGGVKTDLTEELLYLLEWL